MSLEESLEFAAPGDEGEKGAPAWVVTFGDLMSLLLCFFVLMLSFSEMDRKKYRIISGSMKNAFGIQRKTPEFESPKGVHMIAREFDQAIVLPEIKNEVIEPLRREIENAFPALADALEIEPGAEQLTIRMLGEATFDSGSADVAPRFVPLLRRIGQLLAATQGEIVVIGHTDDVPVTGGRFKTNMGLSAARATAIAEFLMATAGMDPGRITTMGCGETRPLASNRTAEGRRRNRRVEIILSH